MELETQIKSTFSSNQQFGNPILQAIFVLIFLGLFVWFILLPKNQSVADMRVQLDAIKAQEQTLQQEAADLQKLIAKLENSDEQIRLLDEALPLDSRPTTTALMIETYATSSGLELAQVTIDDIDKKVSAGHKEVLDDQYSGKRELVTQNTSIVVTGTIDQFTNFLRLLESSGRILDVTELDIVSGESITFRLELDTYEYGLAALPAPGATAPIPVTK